MAGTTIIGPPAQVVPFPFTAPIVEWKAKWTDNWAYRWDLTLVSCAMHASAPAEMEIERRYGMLKFPFEAALTQHPPVNMANNWVRLSLLGFQGPTVQFVGMIFDQTNYLFGDPNGNAPSGKQCFIAHGGMKFLERQTINESFFYDSYLSTVVIAGWIPDMNGRDKRGLLVGNRNNDPAKRYYGGTALWTHLDYLHYLVDLYVQQPNGPTWTIGGQSEILGQMQTTIQFGHNPTVASVIKKLCPVSYGIDWTVSPTDAGFEITIFALSATPITAAGVTLPANPNTTSIVRQTQLDLIDVHIVESTEKKCDYIKVTGKRIVVCGTLRASVDEGTNELVPKWSGAIETEYKSVGGGMFPEDRDKLRRRERYREVYRHFGTPLHWSPSDHGWSVYQANADNYGNAELQVAPGQTSQRETLHWIPLQAGLDYTSNPPTDLTLGDGSDTQEPVRPPMAFIKDEAPDSQPPTPGYIQCDLTGMSVHAPYKDWGVMVHATPNHRIARNHWSDSDLATTELDAYDQKYDYATLVATIAMESDHRLQLLYKVPADQAAGDGSIITEVDEHAELWVMLGNTVVDVSVQGTLLTGGDGQRVLRDDTLRLALVLAGAISRYTLARGRAALVWKGLMPWADLVGTILTVIQQGGPLIVQAPITSVEWILSPSPQTIVKTGGA